MAEPMPRMIPATARCIMVQETFSWVSVEVKVMSRLEKHLMNPNLAESHVTRPVFRKLAPNLSRYRYRGPETRRDMGELIVYRKRNHPISVTHTQRGVTMKWLLLYPMLGSCDRVINIKTWTIDEISRNLAISQKSQPHPGHSVVSSPCIIHTGHCLRDNSMSS